MINRRAFVVNGGGAGLASRRMAWAEQPGKVFKIGWLSHASVSTGASSLDALRSGLAEFGYLEGRNIVFERRWADGAVSRLPGLAAELVRLKVDVICTPGTPASLAAKEATSTIPIVFANVAFPDKSHLVATYARPVAT